MVSQRRKYLFLNFVFRFASPSTSSLTFIIGCVTGGDDAAGEERFVPVCFWSLAEAGVLQG